MWASAVGLHGHSCPAARGIFPDEGSNLCPCTARWIPNHWATREVLSNIFIHIPRYGLPMICSTQQVPCEAGGRCWSTLPVDHIVAVIAGVTYVPACLYFFPMLTHLRWRCWCEGRHGFRLGMGGARALQQGRSDPPSCPPESPPHAKSSLYLSPSSPATCLGCILDIQLCEKTWKNSEKTIISPTFFQPLLPLRLTSAESQPQAAARLRSYSVAGSCPTLSFGTP